ncbi:hypothetical protein EVC45_04405 [Paraburkholderia sp. UYCP14C]|uniref:hypothetical protein n=1 Tax=Paraburkholderia sp. UYCP14C TaxID=2511130 RepID=UPI0010221402|nr:hypothetical protein [Paraburkholderia sp. UYCP14C]RZF31195.1 hypothetical protein EVC45_04405 [Paraburkholderia sp. UYCP14C]
MATKQLSAKTTDFENLVRNGMDFLEKAIAQLDGEPKHSVINFYTAVEIFLKAPLVLDHWTLVVADRAFNRQKYEDGDFVSVAFEEACKRLDEALKKPLKASAKIAFDRVRKHRNRMVHFYHSGTTAEEREAIMLEQAQAWFELNRFVTRDWKTEFSPYLREFQWMERSLSARNHYARVKFESLKDDIGAARRAGKLFLTCPTCAMDSCEVQVQYPSIPELTKHKCRVCFHETTKLQIDCPSCGDVDQYLEPATAFECQKCSHRVPEDEIYDLIDQSNYGPDEYMDADTPANCDECQGYHTVCEYRKGYLCTNCLAFHKQTYRCGWCNDPCTDPREDSYTFGCEHCEGHAGWHADD